jgi:hypothetical protein
MKEIGHFESMEAARLSVEWEKAFSDKYKDNICAAEWILIQACADEDGHIKGSVINAVREAVREIFSQGYSWGVFDGYTKCFNTHNTDRRHIVYVHKRST